MKLLRLPKRRYVQIIVLFGLVLVSAGFGTSLLSQASADAWNGRAPYDGYFSNVNSPSYCTGYSPARCGDQNDVLPPGGVACGRDTRALPTACINSVNALINLLRNYNRSGSRGSRERASSAFIFWTLLGHDAAYANANGGRSIPAGYLIPGVGSSGFSALENLINAELANGQISINWSANPTLFPRTYSEYNSGTRLADVAQDIGDGPQTGEAIEFRDNDTGKVIYSLFRDCANPGGTLTGLPKLKVTITCGNANVTPAIIQPGSNFQVAVDVKYQNGPPVYKSMYLNISTVPYTHTQNNPPDNGSDISFSTASLRPPPTLPAPAAGIYTNVITWYLEDSSGNQVGPTCHGDITVVDMPYFNVTHGDVEAGGNFQPAAGGSCTPTGAGVIGGWYDSTGANDGANTLFSALALGQITGFASAQTRAGPMGLTFANTGARVNSADSPKLGGNYGGGSTVTTNCFYSPTAPGGPAGLGGSFTVNNGDDGAYSGSGPLTLKGGTVGLGKNIALYVKNGDVEITSNGNGGIDFAGSGGGWSLNPDNSTTIPSFILDVVGGDIFIDPGVTNLDGVYVSQQDTGTGKGGTIYTCADGSGPISGANLYAQCNNQLIVHGSFIADQVNLMRTLGTLNQAGSTNIVCQNGSARTPNCSAQAFDFDPEVYLGVPAVAPPNSGSPQYDAITSLPPVL